MIIPTTVTRPTNKHKSEGNQSEGNFSLKGHGNRKCKDLLSNIKTILRDMGSLLVIAGIVMLLPLAVTWAYREQYLARGIIVPASITIWAGMMLVLLCRNAKPPEMKHAMVVAALSWLVIAGLSSIPFVMILGMPPLDAVFEGMSGWTGTGLTMIARPSTIPQTLQFWRSLMQWVGGVGVIVLMVSILTRPGTGAYALYKSEGREERIHPSIISTVRTIWWIYLLFTLIGILLFLFAGMPLWDSINHAMTGIATGGFSVKDGSIADYNNYLIEIAIIPIMILGAIPFLIHYRFLMGDFKALIRDQQCKALFLAVLTGCTVLALENYITGSNLLASIRYSVFQFISGITCTGFQTANVHQWSSTAQLIVALAMVVGGAAGSTAGGVKLIRTILAYKGVGLWFKKVFLPRSAVLTLKLGDKSLSEEEANSLIAETSLITVLWIIFLFFGVIVLLHTVPAGYELSDVIFEVASAQGNVGISTGITGPDMSPIAKTVLIFNMWIGRLEIIPVLMLVRSLFKGMEPF